MVRIQAKQETSLKWLPVQANTLLPNQVVKCVMKLNPATGKMEGKVLNVDRAVACPDGKHAQIFFKAEIKLNGVSTLWETGYLFIEHWPDLVAMFAQKSTTLSSAAVWDAKTLSWKGWLQAYSKAIKGGEPAAALNTQKSSTPPHIEIIADTLLKAEALPGDKLAPNQKSPLKADTKLECEVIGSQAGHARIKLPDGSIRYVFNQHFKGQEKAGAVALTVSKLAVDRPTLKRAIEAVASSAIPDSEINQITDAVIAECPKFGVTSKVRLAMFIGQCAHETGEFLYTEEIGDAAYFTENYEGRDDLGNTQPGDGAKFPGFGWIQTTGRNNVTRFAKAIGQMDLIDDPSPIGQYPLCVTSALFWWDDNQMNKEADQGVSVANIEYCTKIINGGYNGIDHRIQLVTAIAKIFCV